MPEKIGDREDQTLDDKKLSVDNNNGNDNDKLQKELKSHQTRADKAEAKLDSTKDAVEFYNAIVQDPDVFDRVQKALLNMDADDPKDDPKDDPVNEDGNLDPVALQKVIDKAVESRVKDSMRQIDATQAKKEIYKQVQNDYGLTKDQASGFIEFLSKPKNNLDVETLAAVYMKTNDIEPKKINLPHGGPASASAGGGTSETTVSKDEMKKMKQNVLDYAKKIGQPF